MNEHHLEFLSLKESCTGSSESTLVKMTHCWESHIMAHIMWIPSGFVKDNSRRWPQCGFYAQKWSSNVTSVIPVARPCKMIDCSSVLSVCWGGITLSCQPASTLLKKLQETKK